VARVRACPVCESEMVAKFASECEPPVAWSCPECGLFQLESGGRPFTAEEHAAVLTIAPQVTAERRITPARRRPERSWRHLDLISPSMWKGWPDAWGIP